jgi:hypothetical protein
VNLDVGFQMMVLQHFQMQMRISTPSAWLSRITVVRALAFLVAGAPR